MWMKQSREDNSNNYPLKTRASLLDHLIKKPPAMQETLVWFLSWEDPLEQGMTTHSSILAWRIPSTVLSMGLKRVRPNWVNFTLQIHTLHPLRNTIFVYMFKLPDQKEQVRPKRTSKSKNVRIITHLWRSEDQLWQNIYEHLGFLNFQDSAYIWVSLYNSCLNMMYNYIFLKFTTQDSTLCIVLLYFIFYVFQFIIISGYQNSKVKSPNFSSIQPKSLLK